MKVCLLTGVVFLSWKLVSNVPQHCKRRVLATAIVKQTSGLRPWHLSLRRLTILSTINVIINLTFLFCNPRPIFLVFSPSNVCLKSHPPLSAGLFSASIQKAMVFLTRWHNLGVRYHSHCFSTDPFIISRCHLSCALCTTGSQAIRPCSVLHIPAPAKCLAFNPSINPSIYSIPKINPRTDNPPCFPISLRPVGPSVTHSLHLSFHPSLWLD